MRKWRKEEGRGARETEWKRRGEGGGEGREENERKGERERASTHLVLFQAANMSYIVLVPQPNIGP